MEAFLRGAEGIKRQLRSSAWKKCYQRLEEFRKRMDRAEPEADEYKFMQDINNESSEKGSPA